jgi:hypothetical protein
MKGRAEDLNPSGEPNQKTRAELINWRRSQVIDLLAIGHNQEEIAKILQVSPALISYDMQYLRKEAMENISEYTIKQYPIWYKACIVAIQKSMKIYWDMAQKAQDNKEKIMALEHYRQSWMDMIVFLYPGGDALELVVSKINKYNGKVSSNRQRLPEDGDVITPKNGFNPWIYQTNTNTRQTYQGER